MIGGAVNVQYIHQLVIKAKKAKTYEVQRTIGFMLICEHDQVHQESGELPFSDGVYLITFCISMFRQERMEMGNTLQLSEI